MGRSGLLEPIPAVEGAIGGGHPGQDTSLSRGSQIQTTIHTRTYGQFRLINLPNKHVFGLGEESGMHEEKPKILKALLIIDPSIIVSKFYISGIQ